MALNATQKKALADAQALIAKQKARLAELENLQKATQPTTQSKVAKAEKISAMNDAAATAYQDSLTAKPKTAAEEAALSGLAKETSVAILNNLPLPALAYTGIPAQPSTTATWNGTAWVEPSAGGGSGTTARAVLESMLREAGIPQSIMSKSISFLETLDDNQIEVDAMLSIFYNNKSFTTKDGTTVESPFYKQFTSLGEGIIDPDTGKPYTAKELMGWRLGIEQRTDQYGVSQKYKTDEVLKKLIKNNVSPERFEQNIQEARIASTAADPNKVSALRAMGFINSSQDLTDFYMNEEIGTQQLEENKRIGAFATEAIRAKDLGIKFDAARIKQIQAASGAATEGDAMAKALQLYQGVGANLRQTIAASGMYERTGKTADQMATTIQTELEDEILYGMPSERRKRIAQQNANAFQAQSGAGQGRGYAGISLGSQTTAGLL